jgi:oligopeptide/dipeptide ABC transporter ATP-binding protein
LVLEPRFLVADEPVSMLDVSVGAGILRVFDELRRRYSLGVLMITHDLATAASVADRVAVMYLGRIVEVGEAGAVLFDPQHPYTRALLAAVPGAGNARQPPLREAGPPNAGELPGGCRFHPRCPLAADDCRAAEPGLLPLAGGRQHLTACWHAPALADSPVAGPPGAGEPTTEGKAGCE